MNKATILLSGLPEGKSKFIENAKKISWCWNVNPLDFLSTKSNGFYWDGERNEEHYKFLREFLGIVNKYYMFELKYLKEKIEKFLSDENEQKLSGDKIFTNFILIAHGVSKELVSILKDEYGVYQIHISRRDLNSNIELYDLVLYEDDENFEEEVIRVVTTLAK